MINKSFWKDKKVLITGHTGFKGSWLACILNELGSDIYGYSLKHKTDKDNYIISEVSSFVNESINDIRNEQKLNESFQIFKPDIVFHLAAQPLVRLSYEIPKETYEINVIGTLNVLESIRKSKTAKASVIITTDKCYENKEQIWGYREDDPMGGFDPYSSSKGCAEILVSSYRNSFMNKEGKFIATARAGNVIGGGDWADDRIIPDCVRYLENKKPIIVRSPNAVRPWQHVIEPLVGYIMLAERLYNEEKQFCSGWNFGPNVENTLTVKEVVELVIQNWGSGSFIDSSISEYKLHEATLLSLDCSKAYLNLKWKPKLNAQNSVNATLDWYKNYKNDKNICKQQIKEYIKI